MAAMQSLPSTALQHVTRNLQSMDALVPPNPNRTMDREAGNVRFSLSDEEVFVTSHTMSDFETNEFTIYFFLANQWTVVAS
jgi:hypothetical protein